MFRSSRIASALSALIVSATAMMPSSTPSAAKSSGVLPDSAYSSAFFLTVSGTFTFREMNFRLPPISFLFPSSACRPFPGRAENPVTSSAEICLFLPYARTAFARGCSLFASSEQADFRSSASEGVNRSPSRESSLFRPERPSSPDAGAEEPLKKTRSAAKTSVTRGSPLVMVPVLSRAAI